MYTWEDGTTSEVMGWAFDLKVLVKMIRHAYHKYSYRLPRGIRIRKNGVFVSAMWYEGNGNFTAGTYQPSLIKQRLYAAMRQEILDERRVENELWLDARQNMPCDTHGMCACSESCPQWARCQQG